MELNEIKITVIDNDTIFTLNADLYDIESTNTTEANIKATSGGLTASESNEFYVEKIAAENIIETIVPSGELIFAMPELIESARAYRWLASVTMKAIAE